jgi:hypothetical protein
VSSASSAQAALGSSGIRHDALGSFIGAVTSLLFVFPIFWLVNTRTTILIWLAVTVAFAVGHSVTYGPQARSEEVITVARTRGIDDAPWPERCPDLSRMGTGKTFA